MFPVYNNNLPKLLALAIGLFAVTSCETYESTDPEGVITGKVTVKAYDKGFRVLQGTYPAIDKDIFIQDFSGNNLDGKTNTLHNGFFVFDELLKGDYKVVVYSEDKLNSSASGKIPVEVSVTLNANDDEYDAGEIFIYEGLDVDDGFALIKGGVSQVNYVKGFYYVIDTTAAQEVDIYLIYENDSGYSERIRTLNDGSFAFPNLILGNYTVLLYSEDPNGGTEGIPRKLMVAIDEVGETIDLGTIFINREI